MPKSNRLFAVLALIAASACGQDPDEAQPEATTPSGEGKTLANIIDGDHRTPAEKERDKFRHPMETLTFFGIKPGMTVVEVWPGGGWYTQVIAPYLKSSDGTYIAANYPADGASERTRTALTLFDDTFVKNPSLYGTVIASTLGANYEIAPAESVDAVLTFRNIHNWQMSDTLNANFDKFFEVLKPGGVFGIVEHRADGSDLPSDGTSGYVFTDDVIKAAQAAGFDFEASSEINANPLDTKDHPYGVWTLPPTSRTSTVRGIENPDFDSARYKAIGESDRMTLKFRKPVVIDEALLE